MKTGFLILLWTATAFAAESPPQGFLVPPDSISPDGKYGFTVPLRDGPLADQNPKNSLIDIKSGKTLATIGGITGWDRGNHDTVAPVRWNKSSNLALWQIDGKWGSRSLVLLKLDQGRLLWQCDLLREGQAAILAATKKAAPELYAAAKKANQGSGSAFPEGFTIDVQAAGPLVLPLTVKVDLTSNPKGIEGHPNLDSHLEGAVSADGKFQVKSFKLGPDPSHEW